MLQQQRAAAGATRDATSARDAAAALSPAGPAVTTTNPAGPAVTTTAAVVTAQRCKLQPAVYQRGLEQRPQPGRSAHSPVRRPQRSGPVLAAVARLRSAS